MLVSKPFSAPVQPRLASGMFVQIRGASSMTVWSTRVYSFFRSPGSRVVAASSRRPSRAGVLKPERLLLASSEEWNIRR